MLRIALFDGFWRLLASLLDRGGDMDPNGLTGGDLGGDMDPDG